ncbi:MAG TPA: S8/S53 family peptidase [Bdellovibrionota bacterium]|nr:S8/S53 family peptidase [Bdellovibrionota bacterium]
MKILAGAIGLFFGSFFSLAVLAQPAPHANFKTNKKTPKIEVLVFDSGFAPYDDETRRGRELLKSYYLRSEGDENVKQTVLGVGLHGQMMVQELRLGIVDQTKIYLADSRAIIDEVSDLLSRRGRPDVVIGAAGEMLRAKEPFWRRANHAEDVPTTLTQLDDLLVEASGVRPRTYEDIREEYRTHFIKTYHTPLGAMKRAPDVVNLSMGFIANTESFTDLAVHHRVLRELVEQWVRLYPQTLFVASAGNEGCELDQSWDYSWSGVTAENLVVVGATDGRGVRLPTSNFGKGVDVYINGSGLKVNSNDLFGKRSKVPYYEFAMSSTSVAAPRFSNKVIQRLIALRRTSPRATALEAYRLILKESRPLPKR